MTNVCLVCGAKLYFNVIGNIIDYRHSGGSTQCTN